MTLRTRTPRAWLAGVVALLLASFGLTAPAPDSHAASRKSRKSARATSTAKSSHAPAATNPEVEAARTLLAAQDALPKIEEHMDAHRDEEAAFLLDQTRGR